MVQVLDHLPPSVAVTLVTADRDIGDSEPYPSLSGQWVERNQHEIFYLSPRNLTQWARLARRLRRRRFELINLNGLWSKNFTVIPLLATVSGFLSTRRILLTVHGMASPGAIDLKFQKKRAFLRLWDPVLRKADPVFHVTATIEQEDVANLFPWARTTLQTHSWGDSPAETTDKAGPLPRFIFLSRIAKKKNLLLALQALQFVSHEVIFDIFGPIEDAQYWSVCQRLISTLPTNIHITYGGEIEPNNVKPIFRQYDSFLFPTRSENFGYVISESLSAGCPVVCSSHTGWNEVLSAGGGAIVTVDTPEAWAVEISRIASLTSAERSIRKESARSIYATWHSDQRGVSAIESELDRGSSSRPPCLGGKQS